MSEHKLQPGRRLIDGLVSFGRGLRYFVKAEHAVRETGHSPPAVDVAWMADDTQEFPLMIFEVESKAGNTIANNPVKVFGQSNEQFEKPLFFFHVILEAGKDTSRIDSLRSLFGLNNYRLYRLDHDEKTKLIQDILGQHRRIKRDIDLQILRELLLHDAWAELDVHAIMDHVERLQFKCPYLNSYATFATTDSSFVERFARKLSEQENDPFRRDPPHGYKTFIGESFSRPIHVAVLTRLLPEKTTSFMEGLRNWNENATLMPQIAPNFGLNRDYDNFLVGIAPGLLACVAAIFGGHLEGRAYLCMLVENILKAITKAPPQFSFYNAAWVLHMAALLPSAEPFEFARNFINQRGGISDQCLIRPPFQVPTAEDCAFEEFPWNVEMSMNPQTVPKKSEFRDLVVKTYPTHPTAGAPLAFAARLLTEQGDLDELVPEAIRLLTYAI